MACAKVEKSPEKLLDERCQVETDAIKNGEPIDGAHFVTVGNAEINGELLLTYEWSIWKHNLRLEMILPLGFPDISPFVRVFDQAGDTIRHPDVDRAGYVRFGGESSIVWMPEKTLRDLCADIMKLFEDSSLLIYGSQNESVYVCGEFRHRMVMPKDDFDLLVNPFGFAFLKKLEAKYTVRLKTLGGKTRARKNQYEVSIESDEDGVWRPVEEEIRKYLLERREKRRRELAEWRDSIRSRQKENFDSGLQAGGVVLDKMRGVAESWALSKPGPSVGRGRGRGRGKSPFPIVRTPTHVETVATRPPSATARFEDERATRRSGSGALEQYPASAASNMETSKRCAKAAFDELHRLCETVQDQLNYRLNRIDTKLSLMEARVKSVVDARRAAQTAYEQRRDELLAQILCRNCGIREKRALLSCFHMFCDVCANEMREHGYCRRCKVPADVVRMVYLC